MDRAISLVQNPAAPARRISLHIGGAVIIRSGASAKNCMLSAQVALREPSDDQLEAELLIEMRYQQHLAQQGLEELFESAELGFLES